MSNITNITVLGTGVLGSQIAFHSAFHGMSVTSYDIDAPALARAEKTFAGLAHQYVAEGVADSGNGRAESAASGIRLTSDLAEAVAHADLVIEAVPENIEIKRDLYRRLAEVAPAHTIFATNSSTLLPSDLKEATGRPDRFLALHYANRVWVFNTAEIMGSPDTSSEVFDAVVGFAEATGLVPIRLHKEQPGYILNSLLGPLLNAAAQLLMKGVADPETIDITWRTATGSPFGPFQAYDVIGLNTTYNATVAHEDDFSQAWAAYVKENFLDKGKLGMSTGEGFYSYRPAPEDAESAAV